MGSHHGGTRYLGLTRNGPWRQAQTTNTVDNIHIILYMGSTYLGPAVTLTWFKATDIR